MEFKFSIEEIAIKEILKIDHNLSIDGCQKSNKLQKMIGEIIDGMGSASAVAQELKSPVTTTEKLVKSDHIVYVMTEHPEQKKFSVVGILKMGWKKLFLYDKTGSRSEAMVYCLLDFYIHETRQRKGYGKRLFEFMLKDTGLMAKHLAIDKPTKKLMQFMWKHYKLSKLVNQGNNFVIFEEFFDNQDEKDCKNNLSRASAYQRQPMFGRHGAHKHHDSMGEIIQGDGNAASMKYKYCENPDIVSNQFSEANPFPEKASTFKINKDGVSVKRDLKFHHNSLW
ncbi:alpha-tubulin N-acetyltransferase 1-like [Daktulosphaira vitifoliae]|uniref:alpha-tubulin N-acetyltransferase 1-like n=1 Tax=Daktulosphaira vitifoliae TaxID=58002 RepID=UPI0021AACB39|nr:alpha-tubulin N-acetyltransferase 1-like [Daktulosphaira vitifoliae]XP_050520945.1 alpha-tubulin N-acetyltransferase 1-like [Daktulosphaira vitifoliae]XP_050520946.1 alpha-tubulin N-acetyltransferase 1-like [Daktulosphaira vitifoliae]